MVKRLSLYHQLQKATLPRLMVSLITVSVLLCMLIFLLARQQVNEEQRKHTKDLQRDLEVTLSNTTRLMQDIAANDLIINSYVDAEQRENYLPLFFRSLKVTQTTDASLALFQFDGSLIESNRWQTPLPSWQRYLWEDAVLKQGQAFVSIKTDGVLIAVPVLIGEQPEGALVVFVNGLQALVTIERENDSVQLVVDKDSDILYSSDETQFPTDSRFSASDYATWVSHSQPWQNDLRIYSISPALKAYSEEIWLIPAFLLSIIAAWAASLYASSRAARLTSNTLHSLYDSINQSLLSRELSPSLPPDDEAEELAAIREAFNRLATSLIHMSVSNKQFSNVMDSLQEMLVVLGENGEILIKNRRFSRFENEFDLTFKELASLVEALDEQTKELEVVYGIANKSKVSVTWTMLPYVDEQQTPVGKLLIGNDVTEQRELASHINVINHAMESATVSILISDATLKDTPVIYVNSFFSHITGYNQSEVLGEPMLFLHGLNAEEEKIMVISDVVETGHPYTTTLLCYRKNGTPFYNQVILTPVYTNDTLTHFVAFFQDVTEREQTQQFLEDAKQRAEESARMKSSFLASMSHEVRTPLHGISGALQLVAKTALNVDQQRYINLARESLDNLQHIVDDILDFSKIEAGQLKIEAVPYNLDLLIKTIAEQYAVNCERKGLSLTVSTDLRGRKMVEGDAVRLRQILGNLLSNAVKFTQKGGVTLTIKLEPGRSGQWRLIGAVKDTGIGIAKENLDSIFEIFQQEDASTTRKYGGTGLGLSISRQLCHLLGGELTVSSEKGKGSRFEFEVGVGSVSTKPKNNTLSERHSHEQTPRKAANVLIVEDNEINQLIAREHLQHCKTMTARNGVEALEALKRTKIQFDVVLMDCHMPEMDGFETTRNIRQGEAGERYINVPIIALTASAMTGDREKCTLAGMNDYISKPFKAEELASMVGSWIT